ncbi:ATP binding protein [Schizosaccharomyces japonicus yFS275]|uniref:GPN-loop GTPase 2 n=1 Tax=Schizosaccharomyces japonicus (strain yFS275 / FY16936) TaxID=402676 RepID=B6JUW6_SCHJY|nr:ATP binding protein [Schizosaccharomyces japonicus yFS275]EEB05070.1 ATP binding protein [Schizosaccharomyces japonicus yFS275]
MTFCQFVVGPPGAGKSTYCHGMYQFLSAIGRRCAVVNLDPANDHPAYPCAIDIREVLDIETIMETSNLGPNGALLYAMEAIEYHVDWLVERLQKLKDIYIIFDSPGQVELFTHHNSLRKVVTVLEKKLGYRPVAVQLIDSFCCTDAATYVSALLLSLKTMLQLDLPHVNVLSKADLLCTYGPLPMRLDYFTEVQDLSHLEPLLNRDPRLARYGDLNARICELVEEFGLVSFEVLAVENKASMLHLLQTIDKAGGYAMGSTEAGGDSVWATAVRQGGDPYRDVSLQERWIDMKEEYDEYEAKLEEEAMEQMEEAAE